MGSAASWRALSEGELSALCHLGINAVPSGKDCGAFAPDVARSGPRMLIGEQNAVSELWDEVRTRLPKPREDRPGQPVYVTRRPPAAGDTGLRAAELSDLELLMPACAAAHEQEIGVDPMQRDPDGFRWRTRSQIEDERSWLWIEDGVILFKAEASAWTPDAVQLQQVWVDPEVRRRGYGARGLADLCRLLLERVPDRLPLRAGRERSGDPAVRGDRHGARPRLPLAALLAVRELLLARHGFAGVEPRRDRLLEPCPGMGSRPRESSRRGRSPSVLASEEISVALTSRLARTQETLALALDGRDVPVVVASELDEIHFGSFDGGLLDDYRAWAASHPPDEPAPGGGESRAQAAARFARGLRIVLARPEERVLVVGHALAIRYVVDATDGLAPAARMAPVEHAFPFRLARDDVERAALLLEAWSGAPTFRVV